jgi:hypothetical protein
MGSILPLISPKCMFIPLPNETNWQWYFLFHSRKYSRHALFKYETLISIETLVCGAPTVNMAADPNMSTNMVIAPPCKKLPSL